MYREMENEGSDYLLLDARSAADSPLEERFPGDIREVHERRAGHPPGAHTRRACGSLFLRRGQGRADGPAHRCPGCTRPARRRAPACTEPTAWPPYHCWKRCISVTQRARMPRKTTPPFPSGAAEEHPRLGAPPRPRSSTRCSSSRTCSTSSPRCGTMRHHPERETPGAGPGGPELSQPQDRAVLPPGHDQPPDRRAAQRAACRAPDRLRRLLQRKITGVPLHRVNPGALIALKPPAAEGFLRLRNRLLGLHLVPHAQKRSFLVDEEDERMMPMYVLP